MLIYYSCSMIIHIILLLLSIEITIQQMDFDTLHLLPPRYEGPVVGVDFGTDTSRIAIYRNGTVHLLAVVPSVVSFSQSGEIVVGEAAQHRALIDPSNTVFGIKRLLGRWIGDLEAVRENHYQAYKIIYKQGKVWFKIGLEDRTIVYSPIQITSMILMELKKRAEEHLGTELKNAAFTIPISFNCTRTQSLIEAAELAGFSVVYLVEGMGGVLASRYWRTSTREGVSFTIHIGGGTLDCTTVPSQSRNDHRTYSIADTKGSTRIGGIDFNRRIMKKFMDFYKEQTSHILGDDGNLLLQLSFASEQAKRALAIRNETTIKIRNISMTLTRTDFEEMNEDIFEFIESSIRDAFPRTIYNIEHVSEVYLGGDATFIPKIREIVAKLFYKDSQKLLDADSEEFVSGAAIVGASFSLDEGPAMPYIFCGSYTDSCAKIIQKASNDERRGRYETSETIKSDYDKKEEDIYFKIEL